MKHAAIAIVSWLLVVSCKREQPEEPRPPPGEAWLSPQQLQAAQVTVTTVEQQTVNSHLSAPGRIAFDDSHVAHVFSPVSGRVVRIEAQIGQRVSKGAPLATLESPDVGAAAADFGKAEADLQAAERELRRQRELVDAHAGAQRDLEAAQAARDRAAAELTRARERARLFRHGTDGVSQTVTLRAPIDGEVIARTITPGMEIAGQSSGGNSPELFTIGDVDQVWALADVFEMDLPRVQRGAAATVNVVAYADRAFEGRVDWISPALDPQTRSARVRVALPNPAHELSPELYATLFISTAPRKAVAIPRSALLHVGDETVVLVQTGRTETGLLRFQQRRVQVESDDADPAVVVSGLSAGEQVVTSGSLLLSGML